MPLESVTHISDLVATNPTSTDPKSEGDNHLRNIKTALKTDFPNISGPVTKTHTQLNNALDKTSNLSDLTNAGAARTNLGLGTSATVNTGTSGATIPLLNGANTHSGANTFSGTVDMTGRQAGGITAMGALDVDCSTANYFTKTINGASTFTFSNAPGSRAYSFTLELTHTSGTVTWPAAVQWPNGTSPSLTTGKTHLFIFVTDDGGTRWRGSALTNYTT